MKISNAIVIATATALAVPAGATITVINSQGVNPTQNVLLNNGQTGATITGNTNQSNTSVTFQSLNAEALVAPSNGQARVESADGTLDTLAYYLTAPGFGFTQTEFNLFFAVGQTNSVTIFVNGTSYGSFGIGNGSNWFGVTATGGDVITRVSFDTNGVGVTDMRQIRLGPIAAVVPEPVTWAMMLAGFGALGFALRRRPTTRVRYA